LLRAQTCRGVRRARRYAAAAGRSGPPTDEEAQQSDCSEPARLWSAPRERATTCAQSRGAPAGTDQSPTAAAVAAGADLYGWLVGRIRLMTNSRRSQSEKQWANRGRETTAWSVGVGWGAWDHRVHKHVREGEAERRDRDGGHLRTMLNCPPRAGEPMPRQRAAARAPQQGGRAPRERSRFRPRDTVRPRCRPPAPRARPTPRSPARVGAPRVRKGSPGAAWRL